MDPLPTDVVLAARRRTGLVAVFDVDGTLAPIAPTPDAARVPPVARAALARLARRDDTTVGIVSGRPLAQIERLVGRANLFLAGVHGAVRRAPGRPVRRLWSSATVRRAGGVAVALRGALRELPGVLVERKGPVVAVHVRLASPAAAARAAEAAAASVPAGWTLLAGRRVFEIRPLSLPTKGDAVHWLARRRRGAPILYVGDDATDEDAFAVLGPDDWPVRVDAAGAHRERPTPGRSSARFTLPDPEAVGRLVTLLADHRSDG